MEMATDIYLVKHLDDPVRREPRNVGVFALTEDSIAYRFQGMEPGSTTLSHGLRGVPKETYRLWVEYFVNRVTTRNWDGLHRLVSSYPRDFYLDHALHEDKVLSNPWGAIDGYFETLVTKPKITKGNLREQAESLILEAGYRPARDVRVTGEDRKGTVSARFEFEIGRFLVGLLGGSSLRLAAGEFAYRASVAESAGRGDFISFADLSRGSEDDYRAAEQYGSVIDPFEEGAARKVAEVVG